MNLKKIFLYTLIISVAISAVLGIGVILFGTFGDLEGRVLMTTFTVTLTSILGLVCGAYYDSKQARGLPLTGIFFSILAAALTIYLIWAGDRDGDLLGKSTATAAMLATACAHICLVSLATLDRRFIWSRYVIYGAVAALLSIFLYILWLEPESSGDFVSRIIAVLSIVVAALTVVTPVFHKLSDKQDEGDSLDTEIAMLKTRLAELERKKETRDSEGLK